MVEARDIIAEYLLLRDEMAPNPDDKDDAERSQSADEILAALTAAGWTLAPPGSRVVPEGGEWQPIETAPFTFDDGRRWLTWCLLWVPDQYGGLAIVGGMNADEWLWRDDERSCAGFQTAPTHWRHLPAPPALRALAEAKP